MVAKKENMTTIYTILYRFLVLTLILYFVYSICVQIVQLTKLEKDFSTEQNRFRMANTIKDNLEKEKAGLKNPLYVEKIAREELGMTRSGEIPYISGNN